MGASLIFILTAVWYMEGSFYLGFLPIGIVAGIVLLVQIVLLILGIQSVLKFGFQVGNVLTVLVSSFFILRIGFFFMIWFMWSY